MVRLALFFFTMALSLAAQAELSTAYWQAKIDSCAKAGGGQVDFPAGEHRVGTLLLRSKVILNLQKGAILKAADELAAFPEQPIRRKQWVGKENHHTRALLYGYKLKDIAIIGEGVIDGNGTNPTWSTAPGQPNAGQATLPERFVVLRLVDCQDVLLQDLTLQHSPSWMMHMADCDHLALVNLKVDNWGNRNNDGVDLDGCRHVQVLGCNISSEDDAICIKTLTLRAARHITIKDCKLTTACNALKIGTETLGNVQHVEARNITVAMTGKHSEIYKRSMPLSALVIAMVDGGYGQHLDFDHITADTVSVPFMVRLGTRNREAGSPSRIKHKGVSKMRDVRIANLSVGQARGVPIIAGSSQEQIKGLKLEHLSLPHFSNETPLPSAADVAAKDKAYPEASIFGYLHRVSGQPFVYHAELLK